MAFYPDELSPIERICNFGSSSELLDIYPIKNRRQWKSMVLGKKEMGLNNFATITEEKEEDMFGDETEEIVQTNPEELQLSKLSAAVVANKNITFAKPKKYITSRLPDLKEERKVDLSGGSFKFHVASLGEEGVLASNKYEVSEVPSINSVGSKSNRLTDIKATKQEENSLLGKKDFIVNCSTEETTVESRWHNPETVCNTGWPRLAKEKVENLKVGTVHLTKLKTDDKKKLSVNSKLVGSSEETDPKLAKRKGASIKKKKAARGSVQNEEIFNENKSKKSETNKNREKLERNKSLNMKDVVNVYKNLAYGSEQEIKSFVETLSFVKDESKNENDKNLISMMNLKALETKIKNFAKTSGKGQDSRTGVAGKRSKQGKPIKKVRKGHLDRLARQKVVKVPAVSNTNNMRSNSVLCSSSPTGYSTDKEKRSAVEEKEPWKYVGMQSILDKTYLVYPAYPPSKTMTKKKKGKKVTLTQGGTQDTEKKTKKKQNASQSSVPLEKSKAEGNPTKAAKAGLKVKPSQVVVKGEGRAPAGLGDSSRGPSGKGPNALGSTSSKSINRSSATTVCNVEFPGRQLSVDRKSRGGPDAAQKEREDLGDPSLLVYLHGTKALNVNSPYSDRQFSRVKLFRKDTRGLPLIKGIDGNLVPKSHRKVSIKNVSLPNKLNNLRSLDFLNFDEDIENINEFLRSQENITDRTPREENQVSRRTGRRSKNGIRESEKERRYWQDSEIDKNREEHHQHHYRHHQRKHGRHQHQHHSRYDAIDLSSDHFMDEISKDIAHLQYLPDTQENRKLIGKFFEELDERIEASKEEQLALMPHFDDATWPIPILGY
ncbi:hypothetical protein RUM43_001982 [Polyplax serrata]|uniref:Uncharacterized protein n=1 Tax=Polyplax serrata TaxID=468196 RepID=A0AAN8NTV4_POLSC